MLRSDAKRRVSKHAPRGRCIESLVKLQPPACVLRDGRLRRPPQDDARGGWDGWAIHHLRHAGEFSRIDVRADPSPAGEGRVEAKLRTGVGLPRIRRADPTPVGWRRLALPCRGGIRRRVSRKSSRKPGSFRPGSQEAGVVSALNHFTASVFRVPSAIMALMAAVNLSRSSGSPLRTPTPTPPPKTPPRNFGPTMP